ncbi:MAG TPA: hypothetical protein VF746_26490 [Longimicrobium sp.]|jgi:hypothetical protein
MATKKGMPRPGDEIKVGDRVHYRTPYAAFDAVVIEDRGYIGVNGRRILGILTQDDLEEARVEMEVPAEHLTVVG